MRKSKRQNQNPKKQSDFENKINAKIAELNEKFDENVNEISDYEDDIRSLRCDNNIIETQLENLHKSLKVGPVYSHESKSRHATNDLYQKTFSSFLKED